jgi:hypothetical protein
MNDDDHKMLSIKRFMAKYNKFPEKYIGEKIKDTKIEHKSKKRKRDCGANPYN